MSVLRVVSGNPFECIRDNITVYIGLASSMDLAYTQPPNEDFDYDTYFYYFFSATTNPHTSFS